MGRYYCPHFTDKENELQKDWSHSILRRRSRTEPKAGRLYTQASVAALGWGTGHQNRTRNQHNWLVASPISKTAWGRKVTLTEGTGLEKKQRCWLVLFLLTKKAHLEREDFVF